MKPRVLWTLGLLLIISLLNLGCEIPALFETPILPVDTAAPAAAPTTADTPTAPPVFTATVPRTPSPSVKPTITFTPLPSPTRSLTPSGPAKVVATMPNPIPCTVWETTGCQWNYTVTFEEKNGTGVVINAVGRRFIDAENYVWLWNGNEYEIKTITIPPRGKGTYTSYVRSKPGEKPDLRNATVTISITATDSLGKAVLTSVTSKLAAKP